VIIGGGSLPGDNVEGAGRLASSEPDKVSMAAVGWAVHRFGRSIPEPPERA
jgi:hypothetical protein